MFGVSLLLWVFFGSCSKWMCVPNLDLVYVGSALKNSLGIIAI